MSAAASAQLEAESTPSPAVAPPPGNPRFPLFDSLRAIAVLFVLAFHVSSITGEINKPTIGDVFAVLGNEGLIVFFMISGFLLYRPFASAHRAGRRSPAALRYARRRALRIVPAYWVALTALAIFPGIVGVFSHDWWRYYFFLQAYSPRTLGGGIPTAWTLDVEVSFYVILPIWAMLVSSLANARRSVSLLRWEVGSLVLLALLGLAVQVAASRLLVSNLLASTLLGACLWFALGMALAVASVHAHGREQPHRFVRFVSEHSGLCWLGAAACLLGCAAVLHPGGLFNIVLSLQRRQPLARTFGGILLSAGLGTLLLVPAIFGTQAGGLPRRVLAWRPLLWVGLVSYAVYLYHLTIAELLGESSDPGHFSASGLGLATSLAHLVTVVLFVLTLGVTVIVAAVSYRIVELPFLRRKEPRG